MSSILHLLCFLRAFAQNCTQRCYSTSVCWWGALSTQTIRPFMCCHLQSRKELAGKPLTQHLTDRKPDYAEQAGKQPEVLLRKPLPQLLPIRCPAVWQPEGSARRYRKSKDSFLFLTPSYTVCPQPPRAATGVFWFLQLSPFLSLPTTVFTENTNIWVECASVSLVNRTSIKVTSIFSYKKKQTNPQTGSTVWQRNHSMNWKITFFQSALSLFNSKILYDSKISETGISNCRPSISCQWSRRCNYLQGWREYFSLYAGFSNFTKMTSCLLWGQASCSEQGAGYQLLKWNLFGQNLQESKSLKRSYTEP